ncbi:MAG TPA: DUF1223 domain-containing protein [Tepidisphaeraceae bacterium]
MSSTILPIALALLLVAVPRAWAGDQSTAPQQRVPVLVELFTSEGCSSCPPADKLLAELAAKQPVDGAMIVPLALHVDYWDRLGWRDPFSSANFTKRQTDYAAGKTTYTPQMIVDGQSEFVGSDRDAATKAISDAARTPKGSIKIELISQDQPLHVKLQITFAQLPAKAADVLLAITEDGLSSDVKRGENAGRKLQHSAVVRRLERIAEVSHQADIQAEIQLNPAWQRDKLHLVVFMQDPTSRKILAVAVVELPSR